MKTKEPIQPLTIALAKGKLLDHDSLITLLSILISWGLYLKM